jgi:hypothetical protein
MGWKNVQHRPRKRSGIQRSHSGQIAKVVRDFNLLVVRHTQRVCIRIVSSGKSSQLLKLEPSVHTVCMRGDKPKPEKKKKKAKK